MARPTILIGIGSGGLRSIEAAWKLSQEVIESERPIVEYIYLEICSIYIKNKQSVGF